jgi:hypothetical protein
MKLELEVKHADDYQAYGALLYDVITEYAQIYLLTKTRAHPWAPSSGGMCLRLLDQELSEYG